MSEQRFTIQEASGMYLHLPIFDNGVEMADGDVCILLNEQQATIQSLQTELELISGEKLFSRRELERKVKEQQDTIFKLQDLCGESDGENMKLQIENKRLEKEVNLLRPTNIEQYEQIQKLQEENEKLRKELGDCEKFRYTTFKRMRDVLDE